MLKILTAPQIRSCDAYTIEHEPIASIDLMERACRAVALWITERYDTTKKIDVVCGPGNNGGDGLGVARMLRSWGYPIKLWIVKGDVKETPDFSANLAKLPIDTERYDITSIENQKMFEGCDILVDAIFGSGLSRPVGGIYLQVINCINQTNCIRIAIDVPSGLFIDKHTSGAAVYAKYTVTFQLPKLAFLLPENNQFVGDWHYVDIRLDKKFIKETESNYFYMTAKSIKKKIKVRSKFDNKGDHGKGLLIAGSYGKMGACILAARAALRAGIGLMTVHIPEAGYNIIQTAVPEAMAVIDVDERIFSDAGALEKFTVVGIGPGIGQNEKTKIGLTKALSQNRPMIIDADALNILGSNRELLKKIPRGSILTPHPKEFERLTESWSDDFQRLEIQKKFAQQVNAVIVLKGAHTSIATPAGNVFFNGTGNPGMATGGTGDVLTGILTGILAQGYSAEDAAIIGVYLHGLAGDLAVAQKGLNSMIASDLVDFLPAAFKKISAAAQ